MLKLRNLEFVLIEDYPGYVWLVIWYLSREIREINQWYREWKFGYTRMGVLLYESVIIRECDICLDDNVNMSTRDWEHDYTRVEI